MRGVIALYDLHATNTLQGTSQLYKETKILLTKSPNFHGLKKEATSVNFNSEIN